MSFAKAAIDDICNWKYLGNETFDKWGKFSNHQVLRRLCRYAGATLGDILESQDNLHMLCGILCEYLRIQTLDPDSKHRIRHQKMYAAMWTYMLPQEGRHRPRSQKTMWEAQMCIGVCICRNNTGCSKAPSNATTITSLPRSYTS